MAVWRWTKGETVIPDGNKSVRIKTAVISFAVSPISDSTSFTVCCERIWYCGYLITQGIGLSVRDSHVTQITNRGKQGTLATLKPGQLQAEWIVSVWLP
jgi:hypothetical protein